MHGAFEFTAQLGCGAHMIRVLFATRHSLADTVISLSGYFFSARLCFRPAASSGLGSKQKVGCRCARSSRTAAVGLRQQLCLSLQVHLRHLSPAALRQRWLQMPSYSQLPSTSTTPARPARHLGLSFLPPQSSSNSARSSAILSSHHPPDCCYC